MDVAFTQCPVQGIVNWPCTSFNRCNIDIAKLTLWCSRGLYHAITSSIGIGSFLVRRLVLLQHEVCPASIKGLPYFIRMLRWNSLAIWVHYFWHDAILSLRGKRSR